MRHVRRGNEKLDLGRARSLGRRILSATEDRARFVVTGEVVSIYRASMPDGSWTGATLAVSKGGARIPIIAKGVGGLQVGRLVEVEGYWDTHPDFGVQLAVDICRKSELPADEAALVRYLVANVGGVGPRGAERIVRGIGRDEVLRALLRDPDVVRRHLMPREAERAVLGVRQWRRDMEAEKWAIDIAPKLMAVAGVTYVMARRIINFFSSAEVADLIARQEPYRLLEVPGIGWSRADAIARKLGVATDADERLEAAVLWATRELERQGHTGVSIGQITDLASRAIVPGQAAGVRAAVGRCLRYGELVRSCGLLFRIERLQAEWAICNLVEQLLARVYTLAPEISAKVEAVIRAPRFALSDEQAAAVRLMATRGISILTGRPGTGKTHSLRAVVSAAQAMGLPVQVVAPTGKAAARATELTGVVASTIHKLIGGPVGALNAAVNLGRGVLVIDEASMVDADVFAWLARNTRPEAEFRLVIVGDSNQLPSVGPGQVLHDLLDSDAIATTHLTRVQRAAQNSRITAQAHRLLDRQPLLEEETHDWRFVELPAEPEDALELVIAQLKRVLHEERTSVARPANLGVFDPCRELQVLSPRVRHPLGVETLNRRLRELLNPRGKEGPHIRSDDPTTGVRVRVGDRVICVENDYTIGQDGLMNGEQGLVTAVDRTAITLALDSGKRVTTRGVQNDNLALAFCTSVHRSQGSEVPVLLVVYHSSHWPLVDQRLLYTAITRAKRRVILCADRRVLALSTQRAGDAMHRSTGLRLRVRHAARRVAEGLSQ